jgi:hypothetical protein
MWLNYCFVNCQFPPFPFLSLSPPTHLPTFFPPAEIPGVGFMLCTTVDFKGQRLIGQSIIPGIFAQQENTARLMYGVLEKGKALTVRTSFETQDLSSILSCPVLFVGLSVCLLCRACSCRNPSTTTDTEY